MDAKIIFDAATKPFPWVIVWSPLLGCAIASILLLLHRLAWIRQSRFTRLACLFGAVSGLLATVYFPLSAPVRNYGDVFRKASGRRSEPFVFDLSEEDSEIFSSEGPLKGRSRFLIPSLKG